MAAPTASVLDNFNRATPPPSASWSQGPTIFVAGAGLTVSGNACVREQIGANSVGDDYWNPTTFGPDCECFVTVASIPSVAAGNSIRLYLRLQQIGSGTSDGYSLIVSTNGTNLTTWSLRTLTDTVATAMGANITQIVSVGDKIGFQVEGSTLRAWYKASAGSWTELDNRVDGSNLYPSAGYAGLGLLGPNLTVDDWAAVQTMASGTVFTKALTATQAQAASLPKTPGKVLIP
jgi:hypothetical protein